ncbi:MAG: 3-hydroxyacyl-ACP dehydratase FabZ [Nitrospira sp.]|nr:MAG: 3-hydroxyacyl-ACP dehydratase FabZ [Nitrospira sp.]
MSPIEVEEIRSLLPHRYPFLLVDRIIELEPERRIIGLKNVTINEPFFQGHFPGRAIMPGVLIIEAMAQVGAILAIKSLPPGSKAVVFLAGINEARFRRPVVPGDQLRFEVETLKRRDAYWKMLGKAFVGSDVASEAEVTAMVTIDQSK